MPMRGGADAFCWGIVPDHDEWTARAMGVRSAKHARLHEHSPVHLSACAKHGPEFASQPVMPSPRNVRRQSRPIGCRYARRLPAEVPPGAARSLLRGGDEHLNSVARTIGLVAGGVSSTSWFGGAGQWAATLVPRHADACTRDSHVAAAVVHVAYAVAFSLTPPAAVSSFVTWARELPTGQGGPQAKKGRRRSPQCQGGRRVTMID
jgi:hypothetical protein